MDLQMPEMGGLEATHLIRARELAQGRHTPIVAMTANAMSEDRQRCLDAGMDDYLSKPLDTGRLRTLLAGLRPAAAQPMPGAFDYSDGLAKAEAWVIATIGQDFLDDCPQQLCALKAAIDAGDGATLSRLAHTLRGLAGNFNARPVVDLALALEQQHLSGAPSVYAQLHAETVAMNRALAGFLALQA